MRTTRVAIRHSVADEFRNTSGSKGQWPGLPPRTLRVHGRGADHARGPPRSCAIACAACSVSTGPERAVSATASTVPADAVLTVEALSRPSSSVRSAAAAGSSSRTPRPSSSTWSSSWGSRRSLRLRGRFRDRHDATRVSVRSAPHRPQPCDRGRHDHVSRPPRADRSAITSPASGAAKAVRHRDGVPDRGVVTICANTGTYVDSPFHRYPDGIDLSELPLDRLAGPRRGRGRTRAGAQSPDAALFREPRRLRPRRVRLKPAGTATGGHRLYMSGHPFLTGAGRGVPRPTRARGSSGSTRSTSTRPATARVPVHSTLLARRDPDLRAPGRPLRL